MGVVHDAARAVGHTLQNIRAGASTLTSHGLVGSMPPRISVSSAFPWGGTLPIASTADGAGVPPPLTWSRIPSATRSIVVLCEDPDAPFPEPFVHWIVYDIPPTATCLDEEAAAACKQGKNSKLSTGFTPAAPPPGHGVHHYHFQVFALDVPTDWEEGLGRRAIVERMRDHVLEWGEIVGTYARD